MKNSLHLAATFFAALSLAAPALAEEPEVLVTVNGKPVTRTQVADRLWKFHASDALNQIVDETVAEQSVAEFESKAGKKEKAAWAKEAEARLKKIKEPFSDDASFDEHLKRSGVTLDELKKRIESQLLQEKLLAAAKGIAVSTAEVKEFYEANKAKLGSPESVRLRHLLLANEKQAKDLLVALQAGADFGKLAGQLSLDSGSKERGGDLGFIARGMLIPEIEKIAFALKPGEISDVVGTQLGFHILKVEEKKEAKPAVLKDVEKDLNQALFSQKLTQAWPQYLAELRNAAKMEYSSAVTPVKPQAPAAPSPPAAAPAGVATKP